jgi:hypothetical protein
MSGLYNMLFGSNPAWPAILATLGLTPNDVGRYRDCYVEKRDDGAYHVVVHTRNGGGNRSCWHADDPKWGSAECGGQSYEVEVDETVYITPEEAEEKGYRLLNVYSGVKRLAATGRRIMEQRFTCAEPHSAACACPGCTVEYRLPAHPLYLFDEDNDFDCTYADIHFKLPPDYAVELKAIADGQEFVKPSEKWQALFRALEVPA